MPELSDRVGEVVEASTTNFIAQCYELYQMPPLGSLVRSGEMYGIVYNATTTSIEPGRRPIARGKDAPSEADIFRDNPQLIKLFKSEFAVLVVGYRQNDVICQYLPPEPAKIHSFVYHCPPEEVREFSRCLDFLNILIPAQLVVSTEELIAAVLRQMSQVQEDGPRFLVAAGRELAVLLSGQYQQLRAILGRLK